MSNDELAQSLTWREKVRENESITSQDSVLSPCPSEKGVCFKCI